MNSSDTSRPARRAPRWATLVIVLLASLLVALSVDTVSFAATGKSLLLGKVNKATKATTLQNTRKGPALSLKTKKGQPPLAVGSKTRVKNLNADLLDGLSAADLKDQEPTTTVYTVPSDRTSGLFNLPAGTYLLGVEATIQDPSYTVSDTDSCILAKDLQLGVSLDNLLIQAAGRVDGSQTIRVHGERIVTLSEAHFVGIECDGSVGQVQAGPMRVYVRRLATTTASMPAIPGT